MKAIFFIQELKCGFVFSTTDFHRLPRPIPSTYYNLYNHHNQHDDNQSDSNGDSNAFRFSVLVWDTAEIGLAKTLTALDFGNLGNSACAKKKRLQIKWN